MKSDTAAQASEACPLPCASGSPDGCAQRFQCHKGCPLCIPPPQDRLCNGFKQVGLLCPCGSAGLLSRFARHTP